MNTKPTTTRFTVKQPTTLLEFIMKSFNGISRTKAKAILSGHGIKVDRKFVTQFDAPLAVGQVVEVSKSKHSAELKSRFIKLVYEDPHLVVIEKNAGILSMATSHHTFCVKTILDDYFNKCHLKCTAHVVHRLDRDTSGLMIYAKTMEAEQILEEHWHEIVTDRRYVAVLSRRMEQKEGTVSNWLKDNKAYFTYSSPEDNGGKYAVSHFRTIAANDNLSLVEFKLETGRKNQIRVHSQDLGHPVCGDVKYGDGSDPIGRLCLHAFRLNFTHPITGEPMRFETPLPKAFTELFDRNAK